MYADKQAPLGSKGVGNKQYKSPLPLGLNFPIKLNQFTLPIAAENDRPFFTQDFKANVILRDKSFKRFKQFSKKGFSDKNAA